MNNIEIDTLIHAAKALSINNLNEAEKTINENYPFNPRKQPKRKGFTPLEAMRVFFRDGFIDRYSGTRLLNPGLLRTISELLPEAFPYDKNWNTLKCHIAFWHYTPTVDHIYPFSLGGENNIDNLATTSQKNNSIKGNYTLEDLSWTLKDKGDIEKWDGMSKLFIDIVDKNPTLLDIALIKRYYLATKFVMKELNLY